MAHRTLQTGRVYGVGAAVTQRVPNKSTTTKPAKKNIKNKKHSKKLIRSSVSHFTAAPAPASLRRACVIGAWAIQHPKYLRGRPRSPRDRINTYTQCLNVSPEVLGATSTWG